MGIGKILSFISPAAGAITGQGIGKALPYVSPAYGMATGKGIGDLFGGGGGFGGAMGGGMGGNLDIEQLLKLLQGGGHDPSANYLNMFGGG